MTAEPSAPRVGIEDALPAADYHAIDSCSASRLRDLASRSPAYARWRVEHPDPPEDQTDALKRGTASHLAVLEPHMLEARILVAGQCSATTGKGERCKSQGSVWRGGAWWCGIRGHAPPPLPDEPPDPRIVVKQEVWDECRGIRDAVYANAAAANLLRGEVRREMSIFWRDATWGTGLACKGRPDIYAGEIVGDVKVCRQAHRKDWDDHCAGALLNLQASFYLAGLRELGREPEDFAWIAVQPDAPHECTVYVAEPEMLRVGAAETAKAIEVYARCAAAGQWSGYPELLPSAPPFWAHRAAFPEEHMG